LLFNHRIRFSFRQERAEVGGGSFVSAYNDRWKHGPISNPVYDLRSQEKNDRITAFLEFCNLRPGATVLILGAGDGNEVRLLERQSDIDRYRIYALDLSFTGLACIGTEAPRIQADACDIPFHDDTFDLVIASEVLEHIPDVSVAIVAVLRVLKKDGFLLVTVPNWISLSGLVRKVLQIIFRKPFNDGGQPYDNWFTFRRLKSLILRQKIPMTLLRATSWWHFPPTGRGRVQLPFFATYPAIRYLLPLDRLVGKARPGWGVGLGCLFQKSAVK